MSSHLPPQPTFGEALPIAPAPAVLAFLARRRSASALALAAPGPDAAQLDDLLRLAARAPDHGKLAPWRFIILAGEGKAACVARLAALAQGRGDPGLVAKLGKLAAPPLGVVVVSSPKPGAIPQWEQQLSAGAVCANLLNATLAMGFGGNWITDWYSYDAEALAILGVGPGERVAGVVLIGATREAPQERVRPEIAGLISRWEA